MGHRSQESRGVPLWLAGKGAVAGSMSVKAAMLVSLEHICMYIHQLSGLSPKSETTGTLAIKLYQIGK